MAIALIFSIAANVYSFGKRSEVNNMLMDKLNQYEEELKKNEIVINDYKQKISNMEKGNSEQINEEKTNEKDNVKESETPDLSNQKTTENELINTATRFIEYAFSSNPDTYVSRKKMAKNYMTDDLFETLYLADGVDEFKQTISTEVGKIVVYLDLENNNEAIVHYVVDEEIVSSGYKETVDKFVKLKFITDENQVKVSQIQSINNDDGGI